jgi:uncharacterized membrane protein YfcA
LAVRTSSSRNPRAAAALWLGAVAVLSVPGGLALPRYTAVALFQVVYAFPVPILLGLLAVTQARRAREVLERRLWRCGGERAAAWGRRLGVLGVCLGITAGLAVGFYWILVTAGT